MYKTIVFEKNKNSTSKIVCNTGGARSGKDYAISQLLFLDKFINENCIYILILGKSLVSLRYSSILLFQELINKTEIQNDIVLYKNQVKNPPPVGSCYKSSLKTGMTYYNKTNNNYLQFNTITNLHDIENLKWNYIWIKETTDFSFDEFVKIKACLMPDYCGLKNKIFLSYNPIPDKEGNNSWIKTKLIDPKIEDVDEIYSTYKDNPFLNKDFGEAIEKYKYHDASLYNTYVLGNWK